MGVKLEFRHFLVKSAGEGWLVWCAPRTRRAGYPRAILHDARDGKGRQATFHGEADRPDFVHRLAEACEKTGFMVNARCQGGAGETWKDSNPASCGG